MQLKITEKDLAYDPVAQAEAVRRLRAQRPPVVVPRPAALSAPRLRSAANVIKGRTLYRRPIGPRVVPHTHHCYNYAIGPSLPRDPKDRTPPQKVSIRALLNLLDAVADDHGLSAHALQSASQTRLLVLARREFCFKARKKGASLPLIGRVLGDRDHTTILHSIRRYKETARGAS